MTVKAYYDNVYHLKMREIRQNYYKLLRYLGNLLFLSNSPVIYGVYSINR